MTKFDGERIAADVRYTKARRAAEAITPDTIPADAQAALDELVAACRQVGKLARKAGSEALKEDA